MSMLKKIGLTVGCRRRGLWGKGMMVRHEVYYDAETGLASYSVQANGALQISTAAGPVVIYAQGVWELVILDGESGPVRDHLLMRSIEGQSDKVSRGRLEMILDFMRRLKGGAEG